MSTVILTNWTIYYKDDAAPGAGYKQIKWTGGGGPESNTNTVNELYLAIQQTFDQSGQTNSVDDTIPMKAVTPTEYQIGTIDLGDDEPWFIDPVSIQHLTGGALESVGWTYIQDSNAGIFQMQMSSLGTLVAGDIGDTLTTSAGSQTGTLLHIDTASNQIWIRPTDSTSTHNWTSITSGTITMDTSANTGTTTTGTASGEIIGSNIFTLGTIETDTRLYVAQNDTVLTNFWGDGQIDRIFLTTTPIDGLIDSGYLSVYARQYSKTYDHFISDVSAGGRTPLPLSTADDLNNTSGHRSVSVASASTDFTIGETVTGGTSLTEAIVTSVTGSPTTSFEYYLVGDVTNDFTNTETLTGSLAGSNGTVSGSPSNVGPALLSSITITHGLESYTATFDTTSNVDSGTDVITVTSHPFNSGDIVAYTKDGGSASIGVSENTVYYVYDASANTVTLHTTYDDSLTGTSPVDLTSGGAETHRLTLAFDIDQNGVPEFYSIRIDCANNLLADVYERLKYINRRGDTSTTDTDGQQGQQYIGIDNYISYAGSETGTVSEGGSAVGGTSGATGVVVTHNRASAATGNYQSPYMMVRDTQGTYTSETVSDGGANSVATATGTAVTPVKASPYGTFAGGTFFGARGVVLVNYDPTEINNFQLIDDLGTTYVAPQTYNFSLTGIETDSEVRLYEVTTIGSRTVMTQLQGTEQVLGSVDSVTITSAGSGYTNGDTLTVIGGTGTAATLTITSVDGSNGITSVSIDNVGSYSDNPTNPVSVTPGIGGSGATFSLSISGSFTYSYQSTVSSATAIIFHLSYREIRLEGLALSTSDQSIPIQQNTDRVYANP